MTPYDRHLQAAIGYLELGMALDANEEIESIEPEMKTLSEVLVVRVEIFRALDKWELMEIVARQRTYQQPDEPQGFISLGFATRRAYGLERARHVLMRAVQRFASEPIIHYNLACYEAQLGNLDPARDRLGEAIRLEPGCRKMALADADLAALHGELRGDNQARFVSPVVDPAPSVELTLRDRWCPRFSRQRDHPTCV